MTLINEGARSLKFLIESGMERASLVLAAQSITDKLQNMAETLAKIEASDVMPMMDSMKENFGPDVAQRFEATVSEKLRDLTEALRNARDHIGNEIIRMEASVNGEPTNDMAMDDTAEPAAPANDMAMDDDASDDQSAPVGGEEAVSDEGFEAPQDGGAQGGEETAGEPEDFSSLFGDTGNAAGRARKESVERTGANALRESANPDAKVFSAFGSQIKAGRSTADAVRLVAEHFEIDSDDVIDIVLESRKAK